MAEPETKKMRLCVQSQDAIFSRDNGSTLYSVVALDEDMYEVPDLRTFSPDLPKDEFKVYELSAYDHPEHGRTWTIKGSGGGLGKRVEGLEKRVANLEKSVVALMRGEKIDAVAVHPAQADFGDELPRGPSFGGGA